MVKVVKEIDFINEWLINYHDDNIFNSDGTINRNYNSFKKTGLIASIFEDYWETVYKNNKELIDKYRPNANIEINKIIDCYNKDLGCSTYICPKCDELVFIGHTCKSRMCSSCGYKYKNERVESILESTVRCNHRQIVFTIPKELRKYFFFPFEDRINLLFKAVNLTIESILNISYKKNKQGILKEYKNRIKYTPGFFAFLHTFGRDLKWNPHIHVLIAELKVKENGYQKWNYFNYDALSRRFQKILLDLLAKDIGESFKEEKRLSYKNHKNGFYVYAEPKKFKNLKDGIEYVTRYCGRVPISENRIINYDGKNVTFSFEAHEDGIYHEVTVAAEEFIMMLLRHLIPHNFKIIRYYGFYRKRHPFYDKLVLLVSIITRQIRKSFLKHELSVLKSFNRNPYNCPKCNTRLKYITDIS